MENKVKFIKLKSKVKLVDFPKLILIIYPASFITNPHINLPLQKHHAFYILPPIDATHTQIHVHHAVTQSVLCSVCFFPLKFFFFSSVVSSSLLMPMIYAS